MYSFTEKINLLKPLIDKGLLPLINSSCVYLDVPYHTNIGDTLIWEGTEQFLASNHIKCLYRNSTLTYYYRKISKKTTILLHGGGNFGDIWRSHQELRLRIIQEYPNNQIIILPQTIYYTDHSIMKTDALIMAKHPNLTICARVEISHSILKKYFHNNNILLLPDMAFYISPQKIRDHTTACTNNRILLIKRTDKELSSFNLSSLELDYTKIDIRDWPSMETMPTYMSFFYKLYMACHKLGTFTYPILDNYAYHIIRPKLLQAGMHFINPYKEIYTTRLHVAILSILTHKPFMFIDNSYGKNSSFYNTWLTDLNGSTFVRE